MSFSEFQVIIFFLIAILAITDEIAIYFFTFLAQTDIWGIKDVKINAQLEMSRTNLCETTLLDK
jgi:hypothetical protein